MSFKVAMKKSTAQSQAMICQLWSLNKILTLKRTAWVDVWLPLALVHWFCDSWLQIIKNFSACQHSNSLICATWQPGSSTC